MNTAELLRSLNGIENPRVVESAEQGKVYLLSNEEGKYIRLTESAFYLVRKRWEGESFRDIAATFCRQGSATSADALQSSFDKILTRIRSIIESDRSITEGFVANWVLIPANVVQALSRLLHIIFYPKVACILVIIIFGAFCSVDTVLAPTQHSSSPWVGYVLFLITLVAHEFGHAAACSRYGAPPREIGGGIYLVYPVLYSNVSAAWELKRRQRVVVDLAGTYVQLIVAAVYAVTYTLTGWEPLQAALLFVYGSCLFSLNPVFKFDGYWVVADALGVTNLSRKPRILTLYAWKRLCAESVPALPWPSSVICLLIAYTVLACVVWSYFIWRIANMFWYQILSYPSEIIAFASGLIDPAVTVSGDEVSSLLFGAYISVIVVRFGWMIGRMVCGKLQTVTSSLWRSLALSKSL